MTIVHIVLFKFQLGVTDAHRANFVLNLKALKALPSVKGNRLIVGGLSVTDPIERSKGFQHALLSFHQDRAALAEYQASHEHHEVISKLFLPFKEDLVRYDFEVAEEDELMLEFLAKGKSCSNLSGVAP